MSDNINFAQRLDRTEEDDPQWLASLQEVQRHLEAAGDLDHHAIGRAVNALGRVANTIGAQMLELERIADELARENAALEELQRDHERALERAGGVAT